MYDIIELNNKLVGELRDIAKNLNISGYDVLKKQELIFKIIDHQAIHPPNNTEPKDSGSVSEEQKTIKRPRRPRVDNPLIADISALVERDKEAEAVSNHEEEEFFSSQTDKHQENTISENNETTEHNSIINLTAEGASHTNSSDFTEEKAEEHSSENSENSNNNNENNDRRDFQNQNRNRNNEKTQPSKPHKIA